MNDIIAIQFLTRTDVFGYNTPVIIWHLLNPEKMMS